MTLIEVSNAYAQNTNLWGSHYETTSLKWINGTYCSSVQGDHYDAEKTIKTLAKWMSSLLDLLDYQQHHSSHALYLEKILNNYFLFDRSSLNAWDSQEKNIWCQKKILRRDKETGENKRKFINILNINEKDNKLVKTIILQKYKMGETVEDLWFHGTNIDALNDIIDNGLDLSKSINANDFSYMTRGFMSHLISNLQKYGRSSSQNYQNQL